MGGEVFISPFGHHIAFERLGSLPCAAPSNHKGAERLLERAAEWGEGIFEPQWGPGRMRRAIIPLRSSRRSVWVLNVFQAFAETLRHQPQVTIVKLSGMARGGGAEFVTAADMSFAAIGRAGLAQCEALMGIVPGGGGTQYLAHRLGRARALEAVLSAHLFDAETAELLIPAPGRYFIFSSYSSP